MKNLLWSQSKIDKLCTIVEGDEIIKELRKEKIDEMNTIVDDGESIIDESIKREESENDKGENNTTENIVAICTVDVCTVEELENDKGENNMTEDIGSNCTTEDFVKIEKLETEDGTMLYLLNIADIPVRPYITDGEANRVADYMKIVVDAVIKKHDENKDLTGKDLVKIEHLSTKEGIFYILSIAGWNLRGYVDGYEALVQKDFMVKVVNHIIRHL